MTRSSEVQLEVIPAVTAPARREHLLWSKLLPQLERLQREG